MAHALKLWGIGLCILAITLPAQAQRGQPPSGAEADRSETRSSAQRPREHGARTPQSSASQFRVNAPLPDDDPDYRSFYRLVPREEFQTERNETFKDRRSEPFEFETIDYPTGRENPHSYRFDMGQADSPQLKGWTRITKDDAFTWEKGFGWMPGPAAGDFHYADQSSRSFQKAMDYVVAQDAKRRGVFADRDRPLGLRGQRVSLPRFQDFYETHLDQMTRDAVLNPDRLAFKVAIPNGRYVVTMAIGDMQLPRYGMDVYANGYLVASNVETSVFQHRGIPEAWPVRISFQVDVDRNFLRLTLLANDNLFEERCEVTVETPGYVRSRLPFVLGTGQVKLAPFFGKPMNKQGPATQMAISGITIAPYEEPPLSLVRQKLFAGRALTNKAALLGLTKFNAGDVGGAEASFAQIPDSEPLLKARAYFSLAGLLDTPREEEERLLKIAISALEKGCRGNPADILLCDKLHAARFYLAALEMIDNAEALGLQARATAASFLAWTQPTDILYSKALVHRGRCFQTFDPHRWGSWQWAEEEFIKLEKREPGNRYSGYYLYGDLTGWEVKDYRSGTEDAPKWAILIREAYNRMLDQAEWWGQNRQLPDGRLGGGWGDDVEIGIVWQMLMLVNPDAAPIAMEMTRAIAEGVWWSGDIDRDAGFFDGIADVEHTAEWTGDSQAVMMGIDYGNPTYFERNLKIAELMRDVWMDRTTRGHLHFKSMMLGNKAVSNKSNAAIDAQIDHPLNGRATFPAFWAWWYSPIDGLEELFREWAEAWLEDSQRAENGKPAWIIPGPIGFRTETLGGNSARQWRRGAPQTNTYENPTYAEYILGLFSHMYKITGDPKWLKPKAVAVTPTKVEETRLRSVGTPRAETRIEDKYESINIEADLEKILDIIHSTWPSLTLEIVATDRVAMPGLGQILRLLTGGDPQTALDFIPATFERTSRDVAFMNLVASPTKVKTILYSFTNQPEEIHMRLWNLKVMAEHRVQIGVDSDDNDEIDEIISTSDYKHLHRGDTIDFTIPPRTAIVVEITQTNGGHEAPKRVVDLALAPEDIEYKDGRLSITVHNIGTLDCEEFAFTVWQGEPGSGELLRTFAIGGLEAPHDL